MLPGMACDGVCLHRLTGDIHRKKIVCSGDVVAALDKYTEWVSACTIGPAPLT